jgi:2-dehydropantoate 2-reductase
MNILMVGAGGIGGYFGAQLIRAGVNITFLLRDQRKQLIDREGLTIETPNDSFNVRVSTVSAQALKPDYDLIVLAPKAYDLEDTLSSVAGASSRGCILPLLNGLDHMDVLDQRFGRERVLGGGGAHRRHDQPQWFGQASERFAHAHGGTPCARTRNRGPGLSRAVRTHTV